MKLIIITVIWIVIWVMLGSFFEVNKIIVRPAWWSLFGAIMAIVLYEAQNLLCGTRKPKHNSPKATTCPLCGCDKGHSVNCLNGSTFTNRPDNISADKQ